MTDATPNVTPQDGGAGGQLGGSSSEGITPSTGSVDWDSVNWDEVPWDKAKISNIENLPQVRKMQSALTRNMTKAQQAAERERAAREALERQVQTMQQLMSERDPEAAQRLATLNQQARVQELESRLQGYEQTDQQREALEAMANHFGVDPEMVAGASDVYEAFDIIGEYWKLQATERDQRLLSMEQQLQALKTSKADPAANPDSGQGRGNTYQQQYDDLMKQYRGDEASKIRRKAETEGIELDLASWRK